MRAAAAGRVGMGTGRIWVDAREGLPGARTMERGAGRCGAEVTGRGAVSTGLGSAGFLGCEVTGVGGVRFPTAMRGLPGVEVIGLGGVRLPAVARGLLGVDVTGLGGVRPPTWMRGLLGVEVIGLGAVRLRPRFAGWLGCPEAAFRDWAVLADGRAEPERTRGTGRFFSVSGAPP